MRAIIVSTCRAISGWSLIEAAAKSLGSYTWSGNLPNARASTGAMFMHTFPNVCGSPTNLTIDIQSAAYGDSSLWIIKLYIAG